LEQYADIIEITRNVLSVVLEGLIPVQVVKKPEDDVDMTEQTLESLCLQEISKVLESRKGWRLLESDFSSVALQLMFYAVILANPAENIKQVDHALSAIAQSVYQMHRLQTLIKATYFKHHHLNTSSLFEESKTSEGQ
jgi:hypothetical protein